MKALTVVIIVVFIIIALAGIGFYLYFFHEKPAEQKKIVYYKINLEFSDINGTPIEENYSVALNNVDNIFVHGRSLTKGYSEVNVTENNTVYIYSSDNNTYYYNQIRNLSTFPPVNAPFRLDFYLKPRGNLTITDDNNFGLPQQNNFVLTLRSSAEIKKLSFCLRWGRHMINLNSLNLLTSITKPEAFKNFDQCWLINDSFDSSEYKINFAYTYFSVIDASDYINFTFYDNDEINHLSNYWTYYIQGKNINNI